MRLQYIYYGKEREPHPFHVKSDWNPPVQPSVALETFLQEVKLELAEIQFEKPKPKLTPGELQALKQLSRDKNIILKKADKGTTSVMMSKESKINEGLALLNEKNNYQPLTQPMVETTTRKVTQLIKSLLPWVPETFLARLPVSLSLYSDPRETFFSRLRPTSEDVSAFGQHRKFPPQARKTSGTQGKSLLQEGHFYDMTAKWLFLTPNPPHPYFLHTYKDSQTDPCR